MPHDKSELMLMALQRSLRHDGGTPSMFLDTLASAIEDSLWHELGITFEQMIVTDLPNGLGSSVEEVKQVAKLKHRYEDVDKATARRMVKLREDIARLLTPNMNKIGAPEGSYNNPNGRAGKQTTNSVGHRISSVGANNDTSYILARLKRDYPNLAEQVFTSELSPHKAGQIAGFIKPRQKFVPGDVKQTMGALKRHYDDEGYEQLQTAMIPKGINQIAKAIKKRFQGDELRKLIELLNN